MSKASSLAISSCNWWISPVTKQVLPEAGIPTTATVCEFPVDGGRSAQQYGHTFIHAESPHFGHVAV
jgi:hypothetical protein